MSELNAPQLQPNQSMSVNQQLPVQDITTPQQTPKDKKPKIILIVGGIMLTIIFIGVLVSQTFFGDRPPKDLPHYRSAQQITRQAYLDAKNYVHVGYGDKRYVTHDEFLKLSPDEQYTEVRDYTTLSPFEQELITKGICTTAAQVLTCYNKSAETVAAQKIAKIAKETGTPMSDELRYADFHDLVTGETYATNQYDYLNRTPEPEAVKALRFNKTFTKVEDISVGKNPDTIFPSALANINDTRSGWLALFYYCGTGGCSVYIHPEKSVVNRHFYIVLYASTNAPQALYERSKGLYTYSLAKKSWIHLTPDITSKTTGKLQYKIAKDGCTVFYVVNKKPYSLNACSY